MESLGLDIRLLVAQIVNFLIIFFILKKLLYKPILKYLDLRKQKIEESLTNTDKIGQRLAKIEEEQKRILKQAGDQAERILSEKRKVGEKERERIIEEAKKKAEAEIKKGVDLSRTEMEKARKGFKKEAVLLAQTLAEKILEKKLTDQEKRKLLSDITK